MPRKPLTESEILAQIPAARAQRAALDEPHAAAARYDAATRRLVVSLTNGADFTGPVAHVAELAQAADADLAAVEVGPAGLALHWPALDVDLSVAGLARVVFGLHVARAAGALGGAVRSEAKAAAAREHGRRGGRPAASNALADSGRAASGRSKSQSSRDQTSKHQSSKNQDGYTSTTRAFAPARESTRSGARRKRA